MKINFAHIRERSTSGGWISFAVFGASSTSGSQSANAKTLAQLTNRARAAGHLVEKSALAYSENGRMRFYGTPDLVDYLAKAGLPQWTHTLDV